jgi:hypothetical protein
MNKEPEIWVDIVGYEGVYSVSNLGRVASHHWGKHRLLHPRINNKGYLLVNLCKNGTLKTFKVHILVGKHFLVNPDGLSEINHKDEDKSNNRFDNLEWCTRSYNVNYGTRIARQRLTLTKPVCQYDKYGQFIALYDSITQASQIVGISVQHISTCCKKKYPYAGGFVWRYLEEVQDVL